MLVEPVVLLSGREVMWARFLRISPDSVSTMYDLGASADHPARLGPVPGGNPNRLIF